MANRFFNPNEQFCDNTGLPLAGYYLGFYASGTSTPLNTYSDSALTTPNLNPVVLDSAGRAGAVFLQNLAYKVILSLDQAQTSVVWTQDPVYTSDYSTRAKLTSGSGSPNGSVAGTAGSTGIGADTYWDTVNNILYVCTATGTASTAVWTAVNAATAASVVPPPLGYLTPTSGQPIITADVIAQASLVYTPYVGNTVPIYTGTGFIPVVFSELTLTLTASQAGNTIYDVFIFNNSGVLTLVTGPAWSVSTAGSGSRGTGAGTTQIARLSGIWVNANQISGRNAATTYTIPANQATYLGSIFIDGGGGTITLHRSYGQSRKWSIWNAYNRAPVYLKAGDSTASWVSNNSVTLHALNSNPANSLTIFSGLAEEVGWLSYAGRASAVLTNSTSMAYTVGIGLNSTTSVSGRASLINMTNSVTGTSITLDESLSPANYTLNPWIGVNSITALENSNGSNVNISVTGTEGNSLLLAQWRA